MNVDDIIKKPIQYASSVENFVKPVFEIKSSKISNIHNGMKVIKLGKAFNSRLANKSRK